MRGVGILVIVGLAVGWGAGQFLNNRPYPTYSLESMPDTDFTCRDKILGGYYADSQTQCQMFHVCVKVAGIGVQDFRFLCPNGTAFDQDHQICAEWDDVDCDATTLYYASDNFDLYRLGSGFESKAVKYGEEEETFSLQRAETGDARLNREHQASRVNQQREFNNHHNHRNQNHQQRRPQPNERDIFKTSSSSNFFNNRNGGKEADDDEQDEDEEGGGNANQFQTRKLVRKQQRRPAEPQPTTQQQQQKPPQTQTPPRVQRPTGFVNNYAGSSPTTFEPSPAPNHNANPNQDQYNLRQRHQGQRRPSSRQYSDADVFRQPLTSPVATVSTPAPFRSAQTKQAQPASHTENYPPSFSKQQFAGKQNQQKPAPPTVKSTPGFDTHYDVPKIKEVVSNPQFTPTKSKESFLPTTYAPKAQFLPNTNASHKQVQQFNNQLQAQSPTKAKPQPFAAASTTPPQELNPSSHFSRPFANQFSGQLHPANAPSVDVATPKSVPYTQYTPTVPKVSPTTTTTTTSAAAARANRFDETQYDDGSYNPRYDQYEERTSPAHKDDEFLKTAHSQNIASSRNEFIKSATKKATTQPRPFANAGTQPQATENYPKATKKPIGEKKQQNQVAKVVTAGNEKNVSYDYAYYDSNVGPEPEYDIDTDFKRTSA